mmetsp:Transcript_95351/g.213278  ORF Transcript_95351/g.213278 Transcript_95351/m.213278 type:complete len:415 (+) Transcript_95351:75-1319(+)
MILGALKAMAILLGAQLVASSRIADMAVAQAGPPNIGGVALEDTIDGVAHETLKKWSHGKLLSDIPGELYYILQKQGLLIQYQNLIKDIQVAGKGRFGNWKSSEISRALYVGGHEDAFKSKDVSVYLTKRADESGASTLKLYFVDRTVQPTYIPDNIYDDAGTNFVSSDGQNEVMPHGVLAQSYGTNKIAKRIIKASKSNLEVSILKLLEKKDAMSVYVEFAAHVNSVGINQLSNMEVAMAVRDYEESFRSKGIKLFFCQYKEQIESTWCDPVCDPVWHMWFEYADLDVAPSYTPAAAYPVIKISHYEMCMNGRASPFVEDLATKSRSPSDLCREVFGARYRNMGTNGGSCKCMAENEVVFCGSTVPVASRKFSHTAVMKQCQSRRNARKGAMDKVPYCAPKACRPTSVIDDEP